jgi:hypothetical protein
VKTYFETLLAVFLAPLLIVLVSAFRRDSRSRREDVIMVIGYTVFVTIAGNLLVLLSRQIVHPLDAAFLHVDATLGFNPIIFADYVSRHLWAVILLNLSYAALPDMVALAWIVEQNSQMRRALLFGGCVCFLFYALFPAVGPGYFDWRHQTAPVGALANCMPSMHLSWALLIALNARSPWLRSVLWVYAALIAASTLGLREHYLIDLIAAVPYTFAVQWVASLSPQLRNVNAPPPEADAHTVMLND